MAVRTAGHKSLLVIDATGLMVRSQRAAARRPPVDDFDLAQYLYVRSTCRFLRYHEPAYVIACFDGPNGRRWREAWYPEYKANRPNRSLDLASLSERDYQQTMEYRCAAFNFRAGICSLNGPFEADDFIGWAVAKGLGHNQIEHVDIRSDDADMNQLVTEAAVRRYPLHGDSPVIDAAAVWRQYGCSPSKLPAVRAMAGDSSDNIPGLSKVGVKTAVKLLAKANWDLTDAVEAQGGDARVIRGFERIMDLRNTRMAVESWVTGRLEDQFLLDEAAGWDRVSSMESIQGYLEVFGMKDLLEAARTGSLW
jgi:DNA polymerase-1